MGVFRPAIDIGDGKAPDKKKPTQRKKAPKGPERLTEKCDIIDSATPIVGDVKELDKAHRRAEKRLLRARARVESIESDLLLADDTDDVEDLRAELAEAKGRKEAAMHEWERTKRDLAAARARDRAEASFKEEEKIGIPATFAELDASAPKKSTKARRTGKRIMVCETDGAMPVEGGDEPGPGLHMPDEGIDLDADECFEAELVEAGEDEDIVIVPRGRKRGFRWTPKKAIAVGAVLFLILPVVLYGLVIPRADVTIKTWYFEGFQNSIVVDAKIQNHGTVDITGLDLNISVMKVVEGVEVYITGLTFSDGLIGPRSEQKIDSISFNEDQTEDYILLVQISYTVGNSNIDDSFTHRVNNPYMNIVFEDNMSAWLP